MSNFDPSMAKDALKPQAQRQRRVYDERVFMAVERSSFRVLAQAVKTGPSGAP